MYYIVVLNFHLKTGKIEKYLRKGGKWTHWRKK
jgi:hypothetical protein